MQLTDHMAVGFENSCFQGLRYGRPHTRVVKRIVGWSKEMVVLMTPFSDGVVSCNRPKTVSIQEIV